MRYSPGLRVGHQISGLGTGDAGPGAGRDRAGYPGSVVAAGWRVALSTAAVVAAVAVGGYGVLASVPAPVGSKARVMPAGVG